MQMPEPKVQDQPDEEEKLLQAKPLVQRRVSGSKAGLEEAPPIVHEVLRSPGRPLDPATRAFFEPRFGYDFGQVRVHTGAKADKAAEAVNAWAFTVGNHVVFRKGAYAPGSLEGKRLLGHELAHVGQQKTQLKVMRNLWQSLLGNCRRLSLREASLLRGVFRNHIDYDKVRICIGGLPTVGGIPRTIDNRIYIPDKYQLTGDTLIHEVAHVWQYRTYGWFSTITSSIRAQLHAWFTTGSRQAAYNWRSLCGTPWRSWNAEAQAQYIEENRRLPPRANWYSRRIPFEPIDPVCQRIAQKLRERQRADQEGCVKRLGGCPETRPGGIPTQEEIKAYNEACRQETEYHGPDVVPACR